MSNIHVQLVIAIRRGNVRTSLGWQSGCVCGFTTGMKRGPTIRSKHTLDYLRRAVKQQPGAASLHKGANA